MVDRLVMWVKREGRPERPGERCSINQDISIPTFLSPYLISWLSAASLPELRALHPERYLTLLSPQGGRTNPFE